MIPPGAWLVLFVFLVMLAAVFLLVPLDRWLERRREERRVYRQARPKR